MDLHDKRLFERTLELAIERFRDRIVQRSAGMANAFERLRDDPDGEGVWLGAFVKSFFAEELLDGVDGAAFVLAALERRTVSPTAGGAVADVLPALAREAFAGLLRQKTLESLERGVAYEA